MPEYQYNDPQELAAAAYRDLYPAPRPGPIVYDISGQPASPAEIAYRQRVEELDRLEQAVLAMRAQRAAQAVMPAQGQVILPAQPAPVAEPVPAKAKTYALVASSTGVALAAGGWGLREAAPALASLAQLAASAAGLATVVIVAFLLLRFTGSSRGSEGTEVHFHRGSKARVRIRNVNVR